MKLDVGSELIERRFISLDGVCKLYQFNSFLMKLVLKFNDEVKLYASALDYDNIVAYVCKEFNIDPATLHISFLDDDNDDITILSNEDIEVMQAVFDGKEYVKVNVAGKLNALPQEQPAAEPAAKVEEPKEEKIEEVRVEKVEEVEVKPVEEKPEEPAVKPVAEERLPEEAHCSSEEKKQCGFKHGDRKRAFEQVQSYLSETVARLVDERVKALIPCLKEQILNHQPKKVEAIGLIHEGIECKACLVKPIVGVRYECPSCPEFNLCQACEPKIDHDHNLLKIKKIEKKEDAGRGLGHCLKKLFKHHGHGHGHSHGHHGRSSSSSREKCHGKGWIMRKCWGLSIMFGGKPEDYRVFAEENRDLRPRQTFKKYADLQGLAEEDFRQRFIDMRCQKLANNFGKPAQEYRAFVEENYESRFKDLMHKLEGKGERAEGRKCRWGGKRFNFNECEREAPRKEEVEIKPEKVQAKEEPKKEEPKKEENPTVLITDSMLELPKKESPEVIRQKGEMLLQMQDIFGKQYAKELFKFIDLHYKDGLEAVVQRWIEEINLSKLN